MVPQSSAEGLFYYTVYCITLNSKCVAQIVSKNGILFIRVKNQNHEGFECNFFKFCNEKIISKSRLLKSNHRVLRKNGVDTYEEPVFAPDFSATVLAAQLMCILCILDFYVSIVQLPLNKKSTTHYRMGIFPPLNSLVVYKNLKANFIN